MSRSAIQLRPARRKTTILGTKPAARFRASTNAGTAGARDFPGVNERFQKPSALWNPGTSDFSIALWVNFDALSGVQLLAQTGCNSDGVDGYSLYGNSTTLYFKINDSVQPTNLQVTATSAFSTANTWYFICITCDRDGLVSIYVDDMETPLETADISGHQASLGATYDCIGAFAGGSLPVNGRIARYGQFSGLLTESMRVALYNDRNGLYAAELPADILAITDHYWNLNEAPGEDARDPITGETSTMQGTSPIGSGAGPRQATAADVEGARHATLTAFANTLDPWASDTPDGSYSSVKEDVAGSYDAVMTNFDDIDAAHVDGIYIPNHCRDSQGLNDLNMIGYPGGYERSTDIPSALSGVKSIASDGTAEYMLSNQKTLTGQGARTVAVWVKAASSTLDYILSEAANNTYRGIAFYTTANKVRVFVADGTNYIVDLTSVSNIADGSWHSIVFTWDGTTDADKAIIYVDGSSDQTATATATSQGGASTNPFQISGHSSGSAGLFPGSFCLPVVEAGRAWTPAEVSAYHSAGTIPATADAAWEFNEGSVSIPTAIDCNGESTTGDYLDIPGAPTIPVSTAFTFCCWIRPLSGGATVVNYIFENFRIFQWTASNQKIAVYMATDWEYHPSLCEIGKWNHVACSRDASGNVTMWVNGVSALAVNATNVDAAVFDDLCKSITSVDRFFTGAVSDVRLYQAELTQQQIRDVMDGVGTTTGLVAHWLANDEARTINTCRNGYAIKADGTGYLINTHATSWTTLLSNAHSLAGWVKFKGSTKETLFGFSGYQISRAAGGDGTVSWYVSPASAVTSAVKDGEWVHVAVTYDGVDDRRIYINGVEEDQYSGSISVSGSGFYMGTYNATPTDIMQAGTLMDDMRAYDSELSAADVALLAAGSEASVSPVHHWPLDDGPQGGEPSDGDPIFMHVSMYSDRKQFAQNNVALCPVYDASGDYPVISSDGTQYLLAEHLLNDQYGTIVAVGRHDDDTGDQLLVSLSSEADAVNYVGIGATGTNDYTRLITRKAGDAAASSMESTAWGTSVRVFAARSTGAAYEMDMDNSELAITVASGDDDGDWVQDATGIENTVLLGKVDSGGFSSGWIGGYADVIFWNRRLTDTELRAVMRSLMSVYQ